MRRVLRHPVAPLAAFLVLAFFGGWAIKSSSDNTAEALHRNQLAGCERGNAVRAESNRRIGQHIAEVKVVRQFLVSARNARLASGTRMDIKTAHQYAHLITNLDRIHFEVTPLINCKEAYPPL